MILRPLSVPRAESLYGIEHGSEHNMWESYPDYVDLRDRNRSFDGLVVVMLSVGLLATWIPARRALAVDPLMLLREE